MNVLVVIPVFNEEAQLEQSIGTLRNFLHADLFGNCEASWPAAAIPNSPHHSPLPKEKGRQGQTPPAAESASFADRLTTIPPLPGERAGVRGIRPDEPKQRSDLGNTAPHFNYQILIADNGSTDGTAQIADHLASTLPGVTAIHLQLKGRGRALRRTWSDSSADILSYMDVDLSTDLSAFPLLIEALSSDRFDLAIGTRLHPDSRTERCWRREIISRAYNHLVKLLFAPPFSDAQCGFKAITREAARQLLPSVEDEEWFFDTELLLIAQKSGYRICEVPVKWVEDPDSRVKIIPTAWAQFKGLLRIRRNLRRGTYAPLLTALHPQPSSSAGR